MQGIVTLLEQTDCEHITRLWEILKKEFGIAGPYAVRFPRLSYQVAEKYETKEVAAALEKVAKASAPFRFRTSGLGIFTGEKAVIYVPVVRSTTFDQLHGRIWKALPLSRAASNDHYGSEIWMPHITLTEGDVDAKKAAAIVGRWTTQDFHWVGSVANVALLSVDNGGQRILSQHRFGKRK